MNENLRLGSPWQRPGGNLGKIVAVLAAAGACVGLYKILPFLITMTENIITLSALIGVVLAIIFLITNKKFRTLFSNIYFSIMRSLTGLVIEIDPIAIVEGKVLEMKKKIQNVNKLLGDIQGLNIQNERKLIAKMADLETNLQKLDILQKKGKMQEAQVTMNKVGREKIAIENQKRRLDDSKAWLQILKELKHAAELQVEDTEDAVNAKKEEYESIRAQHKAFSSIKSILSGSPEEVENFTMAMEYMESDISNKLGEMTTIIEETGGIIDQITLDNEISSAKASALLDKYRKEGIGGIFNSTPVELTVQKNNTK